MTQEIANTILAVVLLLPFVAIGILAVVVAMEDAE